MITMATQTVCFRINKELLKEFDKIAEVNTRDRSGQIVHMIKEAVENEQNKD